MLNQTDIRILNTHLVRNPLRPPRRTPTQLRENPIMCRGLSRCPLTNVVKTPAESALETSADRTDCVHDWAGRFAEVGEEGVVAVVCWVCVLFGEVPAFDEVGVEGFDERAHCAHRNIWR